jgi:predicted dehydrogenase
VTRFGLIGCGAIGEFRAQALKQTPQAELKQVVDALPERSAEFARRFGVRAAASIDDLIASPDIDAVIVSTPPNLHREHCEKALRAGKDVLCEKPLASTVEDCYRIVETAAACGRTLATGFNYRFYPAVMKARELIAAGRIGEVDHVKSFAGHPGGPEFTHHWVHDATIMGGGALMDNGIHAADLTLHFLGEIAESCGLATENIWRFAHSEDNGFVMMRTPQGRVGTLHASWSEWRGYRFHIDIYGTKGCIRVWYPPMMTVLHERPVGSAKRGARKTFLFPMFQLNERLRSYRWTIVQSFVAEQQDFLQRMQGHKGVGATGVDGLRAVEMVASAYVKREPVKLAFASVSGF